VAKQRPIHVSWRAFELRPGGAPIDDAKKQMIRANYPRLRGIAESHGVAIAAEPHLASVDTRPAHEASKFVLARAPEQENPFHHAVYRAHFVDHRDIGSSDTLLQIARDLGIDDAALGEALADGTYRDAVLRDVSEARRSAIHGVPQIFVDRYQLPSGFLPASTIIDIIDRIRSGAV
jgi:predicted DsbA family dithiol-disulfide isomerase